MKKYLASGMLVLLVSSFFFSGMALLAHYLMKTMPPSEVTFFRMGVGAVVCLLMFATGYSRFDTERPGVLALRGVLGGVAVFLYFQAIGLLTAGEATLLNNTYVVFIALLSPLLLKEKVRLRMYLIVFVAIIGISLVFRTNFSSGYIGKMVGLSAAFFSGMAIMTIRDLRRDHGSVLVFFSFCLGGMAVSALGAAGGGWSMPCWRSLVLLVMMGIFSAGGQILFTYALKFTSALESSVFSQIGVVWTYLGQVVLWDEELKLTSAIGAMLLISSGVYLGYMLERKKPDSETNESAPSFTK